LIGVPLERDCRAADPAVDPKSIARARRFSLALLLPADHTQVIFVPGSAFSSSFCSRMTRLSGL
jgi:hypothetical protein